MYLPRVQYVVISHNPPLPVVMDGTLHFRGRWARTARWETTWLVHGYPRTEDLTTPLCLQSSLLLEFSLWRHNGLWPRPLSLVTSIYQPRYNYIFFVLINLFRWKPRDPRLMNNTNPLCLKSFPPMRTGFKTFIVISWDSDYKHRTTHVCLFNLCYSW